MNHPNPFTVRDPKEGADPKSISAMSSFSFVTNNDQDSWGISEVYQNHELDSPKAAAEFLRRFADGIDQAAKRD